MAQHDYVISNGTGAAVRSDLNNALLAIVSQNSGATEPTTTYAYQWWADTTTGLLKIRNSANNAWITLRELDGTLTIEDGTVSAPGLAFRDDLNTGIWRPGTDQFAISTNGVERVEWGTSEVVFNDGGTNYDFRVEGDNNANLLFVDASADAVGIGTSSVGDTLHVKGSSTYGGVIADNSAATGGGAFRAYRNGVQKAIFCADSWVTGTSSDDAAIYADAGGGIKFYTNNSSTAKAVLTSAGSLGIGTTSPARQLTLYSSAAPVLQLVNSTTGDTANDGCLLYESGANFIIENQEAGEIRLFNNGSQRATIDSSGRLLVGTSSATANGGVIQTSNGITFPATQSACSDANTLDDYEEGTWSPTIGGTAVYDIQWGYYIKIGKLVQCWGGLRPSSMGTGNARVIQGLPFTAIASPGTTQTGGGSIVWCDNSASSFYNTPAIQVIPNTTNCDIALKTGASIILQNVADFWQNNHRANFFITYQTN